MRAHCVLSSAVGCYSWNRCGWRVFYDDDDDVANDNNDHGPEIAAVAPIAAAVTPRMAVIYLSIFCLFVHQSIRLFGRPVGQSEVRQPGEAECPPAASLSILVVVSTFAPFDGIGGALLQPCRQWQSSIFTYESSNYIAASLSATSTLHALWKLKLVARHVSNELQRRRRRRSRPLQHRLTTGIMTVTTAGKLSERAGIDDNSFRIGSQLQAR